MKKLSHGTQIAWSESAIAMQEKRNADRAEREQAQKRVARLLDRDTARPKKATKRRKKPLPLPPSKRPQHAPGIVYVLRFNGRYKIGMTTNVPQRVEQLKREWRMQHYHIEHLIHTDDRLRLEQSLHRAYAHKRLFSEWFDLSTDDLLEIKAL